MTLENSLDHSKRTIVIALALLAAAACGGENPAPAAPETSLEAAPAIETRNATPSSADSGGSLPAAREARALLRSEIPDDARALFEVAEQALAEIKHPVSRAGALSGLTISAAQAGDAALAERFASQIGDGRFVPGALASLAFAQARAGLEERSSASFDQAIVAIAPISSELNQARSLAEVAAWLHAAGQTERARQLLVDAPDMLRGGESLDQALGVLASVQADLGFFSLATSTQARIADPDARDGAQQRAFLAHLAQGQISAARGVADAVSSRGARDFCLLRLTDALGRLGKPQEAEKAASEIENPDYRTVALASAAAAYAEARNPDPADRLFGEVEVLRSGEPSAPYTPIWVDTQVAIALARAGRPEPARALIDQAYEIAKGISGDYVRPFYVESCAVAEASVGDLARAHEMLSEESEGSWRNGRGEIVAMLVRSEDTPAAIELAEASQDFEERVSLFGALAAVLANPAIQEQIPTEPRVVPSSWLRWFFGMPLIE